MMEHLLANNLLNKSQHGFTPGKSCCTNLLEFLEKTTEVIDEGKPFDVVFLDFAKAFDKVPKERLLEKLRAHGIRRKTLAWIRSWLIGRKQRVVLNGEYEEKFLNYQSLGILYYVIYNPFSGRRGRFKKRQRLEVYKLISGKYELLESENNRVWLPEIGLALGYEKGEHIAWYREWLYWYDQSGNRYLTAEERAMNRSL